MIIYITLFFWAICLNAFFEAFMNGNEVIAFVFYIPTITFGLFYIMRPDKNDYKLIRRV